MGVISGLYFGLHFPEQARPLAPFGDIYIELLSMCVLPIRGELVGLRCACLRLTVALRTDAGDAPEGAGEVRRVGVA